MNYSTRCILCAGESQPLQNQTVSNFLNTEKIHMRNNSHAGLLTLLLLFLSLTLNAQTTTGLQLWLKPEGITNTVAASPISFWTDSSSGGYHATNPAAGRQPTFTASALNGYPVAHFTGDGVGAANNFLESPLPYNASTNPFTTVLVYKPDFVGNRAQLVHQVGGYAMLYLLPNSSPLNTNLVSNASGQLITNSVSNNKNWKIVTLVEDATSIKMYENGVLVGSTGFTIATVATSGGGFVFGARQNKTAFGYNGDIAEIMIYTNALTSAEQWATENYLATKYTNTAAIANLHDAYAVSSGEWSNPATWSTAGNIVTPADVFMSSNGLTVTITNGGTYSVVGNNTNNIDFVIGQGDNLYNGLVNMYGGTVWDHKGPFGNGTLTITNGSLTTGGKIFGIAFRAGSTGTLNLAGTGALTVTNIDFFAGWDGGNGVINLTDNSALNLNTTTGNERIGWGGASVATMNYTQSGGTLTSQGFLYFGGAGSGLTTTANVSGGSINSLGNMLVGHNDALLTTFNQSGNSAVSVATGNALYLGNLGANATYNLSGGSLTCNSWLILGPNGTAAVGTFNQSGGTATVSELDLGTSGGVNGKAVYNLNGGTLSVFGIVAYSGIQSGSGIRLGGGTLKALGAQSWSNPFYGINGATSTIDVQGFAVTASQIVSNTAGATFTINKTGFATLTLSGTADNSGLTLNAQNGTTILAKTSSASIHAANSVTVQSGAIAQLGGTGGDQINNSGTLTILGSGALNLNGLNETVNALTIAGTNKAAGTWGATGSGAANIDNTHFPSAGILTVLTGPAPTTLALTASANPSQLGASVTITATIKTNAIIATGTSGQVILTWASSR